MATISWHSILPKAPFEEPSRILLRWTSSPPNTNLGSWSQKCRKTLSFRAEGHTTTTLVMISLILWPLHQETSKSGHIPLTMIWMLKVSRVSIWSMTRLMQSSLMELPRKREHSFTTTICRLIRLVYSITSRMPTIHSEPRRMLLKGLSKIRLIHLVKQTIPILVNSEETGTENWMLFQVPSTGLSKDKTPPLWEKTTNSTPTHSSMIKPTSISLPSIWLKNKTVAMRRIMRLTCKTRGIYLLAIISSTSFMMKSKCSEIGLKTFSTTPMLIERPSSLLSTPPLMIPHLITSSWATISSWKFLMCARKATKSISSRRCSSKLESSLTTLACYQVKRRTMMMMKKTRTTEATVKSLMSSFSLARLNSTSPNSSMKN